MRPSAAASQIRRIKGAADNATKRGLDRASREMVVYAHKLSSGTYKLSAQRKADHPYATRHGSQQTPSGLINRQSGAFYRSWRMKKITTAFSSQPVYIMENLTSYSEFVIFGTPKMVARRIDLNIQKRWAEIAPRYVEAEINKLGLGK